MSEESRLGREAIETAYALKQLVTAGVRVFFYLEDRERTLDSPTDKSAHARDGFADELEREKARQRTYDAMQRKAQAGHVTGGRVFGYDNVDVLDAAPGTDGRPRRLYVEQGREPGGKTSIVRPDLPALRGRPGRPKHCRPAQRRGGARAAAPPDRPPAVLGTVDRAGDPVPRSVPRRADLEPH